MWIWGQEVPLNCQSPLHCSTHEMEDKVSIRAVMSRLPSASVGWRVWRRGWWWWFSRGLVRLFATPWTVAHQAPLPTGFPRQEYWSRLPFPSPGDLPDPGVKSSSPAAAGRFFTTETLGKPKKEIDLCSLAIGNSRRGIIQFSNLGVEIKVAPVILLLHLPLWYFITGASGLNGPWGSDLGFSGHLPWQVSDSKERSDTGVAAPDW